MARKKFGIIDFGYLEITLGNTFNSLVTTEITSVLSDYQKELLKTLYEQTKLVYIECFLEDTGGNTLNFKGITPISSFYDNGSLELSARNSDDGITDVTIYYNNNDEKFYVMS